MKNNKFNKRDYLRSNIAGLLQSETKGLNLVFGRLNALNKHPVKNSPEDIQKIKILEKCLALFRSAKFKELVKKEKVALGILEQSEVTRENRLENLHKISLYSEELTDRLAEIILGDLKRKYNMSDKATTGMLKTGFPVRLTPVSNGLTVTAYDDFANAISIQHIGSLEYDTLSSNESIYQYRIEKHLSQDNTKTYDIFSYIDLNAFSDDFEYQKVILQELLSENNIEFSNANGYIGQVRNTSQSSQQLQVGEELDGDYYYRYQISPKYSLEYNGERIEAIRTYVKQQEKLKQQTSKAEAR